jgi:hypothetical protein
MTLDYQFFKVIKIRSNFHYHRGDSFFQKDKSCVSEKLRFQSILILYKEF